MEVQTTNENHKVSILKWDKLLGNDILSFGDHSEVIGERAVVYGFNTIVLGNDAIVFGDKCKVIGDRALVFGKDCTIDGKDAKATTPQKMDFARNNIIITDYRAFEEYCGKFIWPVLPACDYSKMFFDKGYVRIWSPHRVVTSGQLSDDHFDITFVGVCIISFVSSSRIDVLWNETISVVTVNLNSLFASHVDSHGVGGRRVLRLDRLFQPDMINLIQHLLGKIHYPIHPMYVPAPPPPPPRQPAPRFAPGSHRGQRWGFQNPPREPRTSWNPPARQEIHSSSTTTTTKSLLPHWSSQLLESKDTKATSDATTCQICMENEKRVYIHPCGHTSMCITCSKNMYKDKKSGLVCPFCKTRIEFIKETF